MWFEIRAWWRLLCRVARVLYVRAMPVPPLCADCTIPLVRFERRLGVCSECNALRSSRTEPASAVKRPLVPVSSARGFRLGSARKPQAREDTTPRWGESAMFARTGAQDTSIGAPIVLSPPPLFVSESGTVYVRSTSGWKRVE